MADTVAAKILVLIKPEWAEQAEDVLIETFRQHPEVLDWAYIVKADGQKWHPVKIDDDYVEGNFIHPNSPSYFGRYD